jgi:hypothetical protein
LRVLGEALGRVVAGGAAVVLVEGEAGIVSPGCWQRSWGMRGATRIPGHRRTAAVGD